MKPELGSRILVAFASVAAVAIFAGVIGLTVLVRRRGRRSHAMAAPPPSVGSQSFPPPPSVPPPPNG